MNIYTSYYSKVKSLPLDDMVLVQVSNTVPKWFMNEYIKLSKDVSPEWGLINAYKSGSISKNYFMESYESYLDSKFDKNEILDELTRIADAYQVNTIVLLCYEKDAETCHRTKLGNWLGDSYKGEF